MAPKQDKTTTERHTRTLRELVKLPGNKVCADCKRNDPRWASWNLGVFVCIRCSGIHRSMGTHISKVKSVDLDVWTPEQMDNIQKWGNKRANVYWECHLRQGHVPPDHKIESFIRSKYESRRWAMDGPIPQDPSVLDDQPTASEEIAPPPAQEQPFTRPAQPAPPSASSLAAAANVPRLPTGHTLLSATHRQTASVPSAQTAVAQQPAQAQPEPQSAVNDLFSLDFHAPASASPPPQQHQQQQPKQDVKDQIMSLFGSAPTQPTNAFGGGMPPQAQTQWGAQQFGGMGLGSQQSNVWGSFGHTAQQSQQPPPSTSMMGNSGVGLWGANSGWNPAPTAASPNVWGTPAAPVQQQQQPSNLFGNDVWSTPAATTPASATANGSGAFGTASTQKDDAFGDLWGSFK